MQYGKKPHLDSSPKQTKRQKQTTETNTKQYSKQVIGKWFKFNLKTNFFEIFRYKEGSSLLDFYSGLRTGSGGVTEIN